MQILGQNFQFFSCIAPQNSFSPFLSPFVLPHLPHHALVCRLLPPLCLSLLFNIDVVDDSENNGPAHG